MADLGSDVPQIDQGDLIDDTRIPLRRGAVAGWLYASASQLATYVAAKLFGSLAGEAGKAIIVNDDEDGFEFGASGGGGGGGASYPMFYDLSKGTPSLSEVEQIGTTGGRFTWTERSGIALNVKYNGTDSGNPDLAGFGVPKPSGDFHVAVFTIPTFRQGTYQGRVIGIRESSSGKLRVVTQFSAGLYNIGSMSYSNPSTRVTNNEFITGAYGEYAVPGWMHLKLEGSTLSFGWSRDGANPVWDLAESVTTYCPTFDEIFFGGFFEHTGNIVGSNITFLCYDDDADSREMGTDSGGGGGGGGPSPFWDTPPTPPVSADFALHKAGGTVATLTDTTRGFILESESSASVDKNNLVEVDVSDAGPWTLDFFVSHAGFFQRHLTIGVGVRDSATGRCESLCIGSDDSDNTRVRDIRWNSISSYNGDAAAMNGFAHYSPAWFRLENDGVNLTFSVSTDKEAWSPLRRVAKNNWCANIDKAGLWFGVLNVAGLVLPRSIHIMGFEQS